MDPFTGLPASIRLDIARSIPDLGSLHSLRCASPAFAALLQEEGLGAEIAEAIISSGSLAAANQELARLTCMALAHPASSWPALLGTIQGDVYTLAMAGPLPRNVPASAVLRLLPLAKSVHRAAHRCLHTLMQRCLALGPQRPVDRKFNYHRHKFWSGRGPVGKPYEPPPIPPGEPAEVDAGGIIAPPEWVEEQRTFDGAWRLAYFCVVLDNAARTWHSEDLLILQGLGAVGMWQAFAGARRDVGSRSLDYLQTLADPGVSTPHAIPQPNNPPPPTPRLAEVYAIIPEQPWPCCLPRTMDEGWEPGPSGLGALHAGYSFFRKLTVVHHSPLRRVDIAPFRFLGFELWEERRLVAIGVFSDDGMIQARYGGNGNLARFSDMYAWMSLLSAEQIEEVVAEQRRLWPAL
ncbi:hypothetical protein B0T19DRAFT_404490 [Cercophora scortea]|uniref:F-box domain-containing protein n=1 Tax=Cercophora scortea TaxID=314031 RepID=A0AAE0I7I7_9PEZI|nr:hypothetical protein B0T19DRAFT_404490 [Cercophora scortea]